MFVGIIAPVTLGAKAGHLGQVTATVHGLNYPLFFTSDKDLELGDTVLIIERLDPITYSVEPLTI